MIGNILLDFICFFGIGISICFLFFMIVLICIKSFYWILDVDSQATALHRRCKDYQYNKRRHNSRLRSAESILKKPGYTIRTELLRALQQTENAETLLRAAQNTDETAPDQLLRHTQPDN